MNLICPDAPYSFSVCHSNAYSIITRTGETELGNQSSQIHNEKIEFQVYDYEWRLNQPCKPLNRYALYKKFASLRTAKLKYWFTAFRSYASQLILPEDVKQIAFMNILCIDWLM